MRCFVADTSALIRLYIPDGPVPETLEDAVEASWRAEGGLLVPDLMLAEGTQVLRKKEEAGRLSAEEADEILEALLALPLCVVAHRELIVQAMALARTSAITVYDGLFLALAVQREARLITCDEQLRQAAACIDRAA